VIQGSLLCICKERYVLYTLNSFYIGYCWRLGEAQNGGKIVGWLLTAITCGYFKDTSTL